MKIASKVILLIVLLLGIFVLNGVVSSHLLNRIGVELKGVVNQDVVLMQTVTAITKSQLQKAVVLERVRRIAEELAYQDVVSARLEHLTFHIKLAKKSFEELAHAGAINIVGGKLLVGDQVRELGDDPLTLKIKKIGEVLTEVERGHIHYDALVGGIFKQLEEAEFELSSEDIAQIHRDERKLSDDLKLLLAAVEELTQASIIKADKYQNVAKKTQWGMLIVSLLAAIALAFSIIRSIVPPLKMLAQAARDVGRGDLKIHLDEKSSDEVGEVSGAFNDMARQLSESKDEIERQKKVLEHNLEITAEQKKDLEGVNRELDRFVQTVSHDIRSPLMGISWYADYLKTNVYQTLDEKGRKSLEGIIRGVERSNSLINDLLDLTRISRIRNPYKYVQISALLEDVVASLEFKINEAKVDVKIQPNMPAIICDGIKLKEAFLNLVSNALKFSSGNPKVQPMIAVSCKENVHDFEFLVKDNGVGIAPEQHEEAFGMFKRVGNQEQFEGTGAGLSIVKSIIDDHGGKVWVESALGEGAIFHFTIPKGLELHDQPKA